VQCLGQVCRRNLSRKVLCLTRRCTRHVVVRKNKANINASDCGYQQDLYSDIWDLSNNGWLADASLQIFNDSKHNYYLKRCNGGGICYGVSFELGAVLENEAGDDDFMLLVTSLNGTYEALAWAVNDFNGSYVFTQVPHKPRWGWSECTVWSQMFRRSSTTPSVPKFCFDRVSVCCCAPCLPKHATGSQLLAEHQRSRLIWCCTNIMAMSSISRYLGST
jgi:hypothetical protein